MNVIDGMACATPECGVVAWFDGGTDPASKSPTITP